MKNTVLIYFPDTRGHNFTPPYEVLFQVRALEHFKDRIKILDARIDNNEVEIENLLKNTSIIIISTLIKYTSITISFQLKDGISLSKRASELSTPVIWTGMAACLLEKNIKECCPNDLILKSNYEGYLYEIITAFFNSKELIGLSEIFADINIKTNFLKTNSFDEFGDFSFDTINEKKYIHNNTIDYVATTGCINSCSFCSVPAIYRRQWTHNKTENIIKHIKYLLSNHNNINVIHFRDDNFPINKSFIFDLFKRLKDEELNFVWSCQTSVNVLRTYTDKELQMLFDYGCRNISLGVESGDDFILQKVTKFKTNKTAAIHLIEKILNYNISVSVTSIISFHYNKGRDFNKTLRYLMRLKLLYPQLSMYCTVFQPIPGTEIFNELFKDGNYSLNPLENNTWTSQQKKNKLKKFEDFYFIFNDKYFYKKVHSNMRKDIKLINKIFAPFIKLRFHLQCTSFLWEYALISTKLKKIKTKHKINQDTSMSDIGIRHLNSNYNYGFIEKTEE